MKIIFRVKGGYGYGWGHIVRMKTLAAYVRKRLGDSDILFVVEGNDKAVEYIQKGGLAVHGIPFDLSVEEESLSWPFKDPVDVLVVDMFDIEPERIRLFREKSTRLVMFDDMECSCPFADVIFCPQSLDYNEIERRSSQIFLKGPKYFMIGEEFQALHNRRKKINRTPGRVLVCLGGSTPPASQLKVARALSAIQGSFDAIDFIVGYEAGGDLIRTIAELLPKADIIESTNEMPRLLDEADLAVIAGGFLKYELAAVGTPGVILSLVEHQHILSLNFSKTGAADYSGKLELLSEDEIGSAISILAKDFEKRKRMSLAGKRLVDCKGVERVFGYSLQKQDVEKTH